MSKFLVNLVDKKIEQYPFQLVTIDKHGNYAVVAEQEIVNIRIGRYTTREASYFYRNQTNKDILADSKEFISRSETNKSFNWKLIGN